MSSTINPLWTFFSVSYNVHTKNSLIHYVKIDYKYMHFQKEN